MSAGRITGLCGLTLVLACTDPFMPTPDVDTGTGGGSDSEPPQTVVHDGGGRGAIFPPVLRDVAGLVTVEVEPGSIPVAHNAIVIGTPQASFDGVEGAGQVAVLIDDGVAHVPAQHRPAWIVEDQHAPVCANNHRFAWELSADRGLGSALAFYVRHAGESFTAYEGQIATAAATAAADSGRVLLYPGCLSCAVFPKPDGESPLIGGRFGAAIGFGFFGDRDEPPLETMLVGAPHDGDGRVAVLGEGTFRTWELSSTGTIDGIRECQCMLDGVFGNHDCEPWAGQLQGSYANEEFGAALAVADFDCDGVDDVAVGAPAAALPVQGGGVVEGAGAVYVYMNGPEDLPGGALVLRQGTPEVGGLAEVDDRFGATLIAGRFSGTRLSPSDRSCFDLIVAAPGEDGGTGEIQLFEGGPEGLGFGGPIVRLDALDGAAGDPGDGFGHAMTAGDFNWDGYDDLVVSAPWDVGGGAVMIIPGSASGLRLDLAKHWSQVGAENEFGDEAGYALSWTRGRAPESRGSIISLLVIAVPGEDGGVGAVLTRRISQTQTGQFALGGGADWTALDFGGDNVAGHRFGEVLMPARAMPRRPWEFSP